MEPLPPARGEVIQRMPIEELSLEALRARASLLGWTVRSCRSWSRVGTDAFVVLNRCRNLVVTELLDSSAVREWLIDALRERRRAYYW